MYLKSITLHGFKSFAEKTTLLFSAPEEEGTLPLTAVVGPNGSGKCIHGSSRVMLTDGRMIAIRDLFEGARSYRQGIEQWDDGECVRYNPEGLSVFSLNPSTLKLETRAIGAFIKRKSPAYLLRVHTRTGKEIHTTHYHPFFTLRKGRLHTLRAEELKQGVRIATPRILPIAGQAIKFDNESILNSFTHEDSVYVPWSESVEHAVRGQATAAGSLTELTSYLGIPRLRLSALYERQAVSVAALAPLAPILPEIHTLKSKGTGHVQLPKTLDEPLARFLGYVISEGRLNPGQVWFVNEDPALIDDFCKITREVFGLEAKRFAYKPNSTDVIIFSTTLGHLLEKVFGITIAGPSRVKKVPPQLFQAPLPIVSSFLAALFEGDGYIHTGDDASRGTYIEYSSASKELAQGVVTLLLRFGILSMCQAKEKYASNTVARTKRTYYSVFIYGNNNLRTFAEQISFRGKKQSSLLRLVNLPLKTNPNLDLVPTATALVHEAVVATHTIMKPLRKVSSKLAAYYEGRCEASRGGLAEAAAVIRAYRSKPPGDELLTQIDTLAASDVLWDEIVSVEKIEPEEWVYDLSISETHNFVSENFIVHNSNIADAIRWVLGEQSIKAIRGKKSEDVIFAGSGRRARASVAEVQLTVNNDDGRIPIEVGEVMISRRLYRDGESEYLLNNKATRLMDIQMLLARAAFGKEGYSVIGQGQIDAILTASAEERKAFFDEATGVRPLQIKKEQALKKLTAVEENLNQALLLQEEIEPRVRSLTRQVKRLERREEVERELHELQTRYYGTLLHEMGMEHGAWSKKMRGIEERKNERTKELKHIELEMKALEKEETKPAELLKIQSEYEKLIAGKEKLREREFELKRAALEAKKETVAVPTHEIVEALEGVKRELESIFRTTPNPSSERRGNETISPPVSLREIPRRGTRGGDSGGVGAHDRLLALLTTVSDLLARLKGERAPRSARLTSDELEKIAKDLAAVDRDLERLKSEMQKVGQAAEEKKRAFFEIQRRLGAKQSEVHALETELGDAKIEMAKVETRREDLEKEARSEMGDQFNVILSEAKDLSRMREPTFVGDSSAMPRNDRKIDPNTILPEIQKLKHQLELIGGVDEETMKEYKEVKERHDFLKGQIADLEASLASLISLLEELDSTIKTQFEQSFEKINHEFGNYFKILFGGGQAKLSRIVVQEENASTELDDNAPPPPLKLRGGEGGVMSGTLPERPSLLDKFTKRDSYRGIEISATPPGKKLKSIAMLSGGEKALTSIALLSAILALNPPPFVVLDEVDAALDEANSARFASILIELAHRTQFIVITHNRATMHAAQVLYGVTMGEDGVSKILSLKLDEATTEAIKR